MTGEQLPEFTLIWRVSQNDTTLTAPPLPIGIAGTDQGREDGYAGVKDRLSPTARRTGNKEESVGLPSRERVR